ncbi:MAG: hypothetical protein AAF152_04540 [Cyanobacteria bacterium P01_A01_bin.114]
MKVLWFVLDFMPALADRAAAESVTTQIFLELMDCNAVGNLKRLTQTKAGEGDLTEWAAGILKIEVYLPRLRKVIDLLKTHLQAPIIFYVEVQGVQKPIRVDLTQDAETVTTSLLKSAGDLLGTELGD